MAEHNIPFSSFIETIETFKIDFAKKLKSPKVWATNRRILTRYLSCFHPHFIVWVSAFQNSVKTPEGFAAASDNIFLELTENHQTMLYNFMAAIGVRPSDREYQALLPVIEEINKIMIYGVKNDSGAGPAMVIYALEEISKIFIPWLGDIATKRGASDLSYVEKHGEADAEHSLLARKALEAELDMGSSHEKVEVLKATGFVMGLLSLIFIKPLEVAIIPNPSL